jgi:hypothetical protein
MIDKSLVRKPKKITREKEKHKNVIDQKKQER